MIVDEESVLDTLKDHVQSTLNTKIAEINTRKSDGITLDTVSNSAYVFQTMNEFVANYNPMLFYGIDRIDTSDSIGPGSIATLQVEFTIILEDKADKNLQRRLLRYQRALREIFEDNYVKTANTKRKFKISNLEQVSFTLTENDSTRFFATGVLLETDIG